MRLAIDAPEHLPVMREELLERVDARNSVSSVAALLLVNAKRYDPWHIS